MIPEGRETNEVHSTTASAYRTKAGFRSHVGVGRASQVAPVAKDPPANSGSVRDLGSIPGLGRSPGEGHGHPLQYSCLDNPKDRGAWWATVHGVTKSQAQLSN